MTPPPCFTSTGPVHMSTSPLENLLIEHPSMSVYQQPSLPGVGRSLSPSLSEDETELVEIDEEDEEVEAAIIVAEVVPHLPTSAMTRSRDLGQVHGHRRAQRVSHSPPYFPSFLVWE